MPAELRRLTLALEVRQPSQRFLLRSLLHREYQVRCSEPDTRDATAIAEEIVATVVEPPEPTLSDEAPPALSSVFLDAVGEFPSSSLAREQIWTCSPVKSNKFA